MIHNAYRLQESEMIALRAAAQASASELSDEDLLHSSTLFDSEHYLSANPDVAKAGVDPVTHYLRDGAAEGRDPSQRFSTSAYLQANPDVASEGMNPLVHYLRLGMLEGRQPSSDGVSARQLTGPLNAAHHALLASSSLFDHDYYCTLYPDVASQDQDPITHYLTAGASEGRDPSESFCTLAYLRQHHDVAAAGFNPLVHYLEIGKSEGRLIARAKPLVPTFSQLFDARWPYLKPLSVYQIPAGTPRLTLITDSIGPASLFGGVGTALILGALLANKLGATLRIATRHDEPDGRALAKILASNKILLENPIELAFAPENGAPPLSLSSNDFFLTTSWWTTYPVLRTVARDRVAYLLQEDERMFYPYGDERLLCAETLNEPDLSLVINTKLLGDHLSSGSALQGMKTDFITFEPAFPSALTTRLPSTKIKRKFFFYSRPNNGRNLFWRGASALADAIADGILDPAEWEFYFVGKATPMFTLPRGATFHAVEGLNWSDYHALVGQMDAALVLMDTPHPSYPPLDLAAAGAAVLTNTHPGKVGLSNYSANILTAEPSCAGLRDGLRCLSLLGKDDIQRAENRDSDRICRDWNVALEGTVNWLSSRYVRAK